MLTALVPDRRHFPVSRQHQASGSVTRYRLTRLRRFGERRVAAAGPAAWLYGVAASAPYAVAAIVVLAAAVALSRK